MVGLRGLQEVDGSDFPSDTKKYYVVVTPGEIRPKITVPIKYFTTPSVSRNYSPRTRDHICSSLRSKQKITHPLFHSVGPSMALPQFLHVFAFENFGTGWYAQHRQCRFRRFIPACHLPYPGLASQPCHPENWVGMKMMNPESQHADTSRVGHAGAFILRTRPQKTRQGRPRDIDHGLE